MVRAMPKARAISLPLNQRLMMALCTTIRDSEPAPKIKPAGEELPLGVGEGHYGGAQEDEAAEQQAGAAGAQLVVKHAAEEHDDDGGHGVCRVEIPDGAAVQMQRIDESGREGADAVIGEIAPQHQQADEHQDSEAVRALRGMEESHGFRSFYIGGG